jgi:hypothetical protein
LISLVCFRRSSEKSTHGSCLRHKDVPEIKIIITFEDTFHAYQGALAAAIKILRPDVEVKTIELEGLHEMVKGFEPDIVLGSGFDEEEVRDVPSWIGLTLDPDRPTRICVHGIYSEIVNPTLDKTLAIIEEAEQHTRNC